MGVWDYVIMVINMVLFWGLIVLGLVGLFHYLASEIDEHQHHQRLKALRRTSRPHVKASDHRRRAA
jgi:hypothetical protein